MLDLIETIFQDDGTNESAVPRFHSSSMTERLSDLSATLCNTLQSGHPGAQIEAARVLGNMTRSPVARKALCAAGGLKLLVKNLESEDTEFVSTSCGVLVNLMSDWERRAPFRELRGPYLLRDVLQRGALSEDWLLAATACQVSKLYILLFGLWRCLKVYFRRFGISSSILRILSTHSGRMKPIILSAIWPNILVT